MLPGLAAKRKAQLAREIAKAAVRLQAIEANRAVGNFAHDARGNARLNRRFALQKRKAAKAYAAYRGWNSPSKGPASSVVPTYLTVAKVAPVPLVAVPLRSGNDTTS